MSNKFNYEAFRDMDYVFTTAKVHPLSMIIRSVSAGVKNIFNNTIASHEGRLIALECGGVKVWHIWEMMPGSDGQSGDLKLHPLSSYLTNGIWSSKIIAIKRHRAYDKTENRKKAVQLCMDLWLSGKVHYDYSGCGRWWKLLSKLKDKSQDYYCSEISEFVDQSAVGFSSVGLMGLSDDATPYMHQRAITESVQVYK